MRKVFSYIYWAIRLIVLILIFTAVDYFFHSLSDKWAVPEYYFKNKVVFGFFWSIPAVFVALKLSKIWQRSLLFSLIVSIVLQINYYLKGYPVDFVLIFLIIHFCILYVLSSLMFNNKKI